jgi:hypothetical protein
MTKYSYEVQLLRAGRWTIAEILEERGAAEKTADTLLKQHDVDAVRVVRDLLSGDGLHKETEILRKDRHRTAAGPKLLAADIDAAPPCERVADLLQQAARTALARVLRGYCEKETVTATELLTSHQLIKRVMAQPDLVGSAVDRVVRAQRKHCDDDPQRLSEHLYALVDKVARRARHAYVHPAVQSLRAGGFSALLADLLGRHSQEKSEYIALAALSRRTLGARSWLGKLDVICGETEASDPAALQLLDAAVADVLAAPGAMRDLLGPQKTLAAALHATIDFRAGTWVGEHAATAKLAALFRAGHLEQTRSALLAACVAGLAGAKPLDRDDPARERAAFEGLLAKLCGDKGLTGGGAMAEAAVLRATRWMVHGGAVGRSEALNLILRSLPAPSRRVLFLTELAGSPLAGEMAGAIEAGLRATLHGCRSIDDLLQDKAAGQLRKMGALVAIHTRIDESLLHDDVRAHCLDRLDQLLAEYVMRERVIEALDDPGSDLHTRATRLVRFCTSGHLTPGRALRLARERVVRHLRQPNFDARLVAHAPARDRERLLREFHQLLESAGFRTT